MPSASIALNAHLLSAQVGYRSAGIHGYIYNTLRFLPESDPALAYHVLVGEGSPPPHDRVQIHRAKFSTTSPIRRIFWEQLIQPRLLKNLNADLYHAMAFVAPMRLTMSSVVTVYDLSFMRYPQSLSLPRRWYLRLFTKRSCQQASRVIAISRSTADDLAALMDIPRQRIAVAVPGVGEQFRPLDPAAIEAFRRKLPKRFILHLGTLEPRKNIPMLLQAYAALPESLRNAVHLVLAGGKGWDYEAIFATIEAFNLASTVHLPGYVDDADLPLWYNAADVLVYPSVYEGWGLPVIEAMACGCPTLVSDVSSLPEASGETGKRLPPHDTAAWTEALHDALTDAAWRESSGRAGIARAKQFTWQQTAAVTVQAYRDVLEGV